MQVSPHQSNDEFACSQPNLQSVCGETKRVAKALRKQDSICPQHPYNPAVIWTSHLCLYVVSIQCLKLIAAPGILGLITFRLDKSLGTQAVSSPASTVVPHLLQTMHACRWDQVPQWLRNNVTPILGMSPAYPWSSVPVKPIRSPLHHAHTLDDEMLLRLLDLNSYPYFVTA